MGLFAKKTPRIAFDPQVQEPAVRKSICTGEMTVGFVNRKTGKFQDMALVDEAGLEAFRQATGAEHIRVIY